MSNFFCNNKNVLRAQSMVWHFVRHPVVAFSTSASALKCINYFTQKYWQFCILIQIVDVYWVVRNRTWYIITRISIFKRLNTFSFEFWKQVIVKQASCLIRDFELITPSIHVSSYMSSSTISVNFIHFLNVNSTLPSFSNFFFILYYH